MSTFLKLHEDKAFPTLTVNSRLARWLLLEHHEKQKALGRKVWPTPEILPLTAWLQQVWMQSWPQQYILTDPQSRQLWGKIVRQDPQQNISNLMHLSETAKRSAEAYALIQEYRLPGDEFEIFPTEESLAFKKWMNLYKSRLKKMAALDPASVMDEVSRAMRQGSIPIPERIDFAGFEDITPQFQSWLDLLKDHRVSIRFSPEILTSAPPQIKSQTSGKDIETREFADKKSEARHCARWVRANYQPGKRIGVVVIDLQSYRSLLKRELSAELAPESVYPWVDKERPFNISLGPTLWEEPMINSAGLMLSIHAPAVPLKAFFSIIRSPYFHIGKSQSREVHLLENKLLRRKALIVNLSELNQWTAPSQSNHLADFTAMWMNHLRDKENRPPSQWAKEFADFLKTMGWPSAGRTLTSREFQVYEAWKGCLDEFATLDPVLHHVSQKKAVDTLLSMIREQPFQEKTRNHPIQVMGLLESSGMRFDHLWVMGCNAEVFPALPSPNPFLPIAYRKKHNLPHSTAQRELEFAKNSLSRLVASAPSLVFSYPVWDENVELKISPLIAELADKPDTIEANSLDLDSSHRLMDQFPPKPALETVTELSLLPVTPSEKETFETKGPRGGYRFLKDQAECPFRAFATYRLNAQKEEFPELDFDLQERGTLVHKALEIFWKQTRSHDALIKLIEEGLLLTAVKGSVQKALKEYENKFAHQNLFYQLEMERVYNLLLEWLNVEKMRSPFEVTALEKEQHVEISGIKLRLRIDRIDKTDNGKVVLIDYKTGSAHCSQWFGDRIQEPQLPLYAYPISPDAVAFAQVKKGSSKLQGAFDPSQPIQGVSKLQSRIFPTLPSWQDQLEDWRKHLKSMADEFLSGETQVNPLKGPPTCTHCDLKTLCRISEKPQGFFAMEDDE
jgi:ATP-dependent helicase/nuclease subunit B